jgi:uncharacterized protein YbjT (DUF2867 family)
LSRRPDNLKPFVERGARVFIGSQDDADFLIRSTKDVDALLWVTPPGYGSDNVRVFQNRLGKAGATAVRTNRIPRVVNLSSIGAQFLSGVGPVNGLHDVENWFNDAAENVTHLRPGFFFENLLWHVESIKKHGRISLPVSGSRRYPMLATRDIGRAAAERLSDPAWTGQCIRELHGPVDLSFDEVAGILSDVLGRKITYAKCSREDARRHLIENAISDNAADLMMEMYDAAETGKLRATQPRSEETTTPTTLAEFAHEIMLPMMAEPAVS